MPGAAQDDHESENEGFHTIGSLTVSASLAASTEPAGAGGDAGGAAECPQSLAGLVPCDSSPAVSNVRRRIRRGMTVRLMTRLAIESLNGGDGPSEQRAAGRLIKGTAGGAEAVSHKGKPLTLIRRRKAKRDNSRTTPYRLTMQIILSAISSGMSCLHAMRGVLTVPAKSSSGNTYCITDSGSRRPSAQIHQCCQAATKPSRKVTTIGRSAPKMMSSMAVVHGPEPLKSGACRCPPPWARPGTGCARAINAWQLLEIRRQLSCLLQTTRDALFPLLFRGPIAVPSTTSVRTC